MECKGIFRKSLPWEEMLDEQGLTVRFLCENFNPTPHGISDDVAVTGGRGGGL